MLPPPLQSSLPAGWLAFTGRELNPLDRYKRFQITLSSPFSEFILAQCKVHRDVVVLIVDLPDSTLAIPEWMARPEAAALGVRSPPLVPLQHLRELRITLDSLLSSLSDDSSSGGGDEATTCFRSTDFASTEPTRFCVARDGTRRARTIGPENAVGDLVQWSRAHVKQGER